MRKKWLLHFIWQKCCALYGKISFWLHCVLTLSSAAMWSFISLDRGVSEELISDMLQQNHSTSLSKKSDSGVFSRNRQRSLVKNECVGKWRRYSQKMNGTHDCPLLYFRINSFGYQSVKGDKEVTIRWFH